LQEERSPPLAAPAELTLGLVGDERGEQVVLAAVRGRHGDAELAADLRRALHLDEERVPLRVAGEIREHLPHGRRGSGDLDFGAQLHAPPAYPSAPGGPTLDRVGRRARAGFTEARSQGPAQR